LSDSLVILGSQWGDEGKGKVVDLLTTDFDYIVRYQGGSNAGHTVIIGDKKYALHLIPSGILREGKKNLITNGVVIALEELVAEMEKIKDVVDNFEGRLYISDRAHIVFPYHKLLDQLSEQSKKGSKVGTTLKGIGPAYMSKYGRTGIRIADLFEPTYFKERLKNAVEEAKKIAENVYGVKTDLDTQKIYDETMGYFEKIAPLVADTSLMLYNAMEKGEKVLFEGAQGTMLDIDMGTYPYVTSSNSSALGLCNGTGLPPKLVGKATVWGVSKAYVTRVGAGPFPTELKDRHGELLRERGHEYGTTTGRPRRTGWLDLVALRFASRINGFDGLVITKLDVLDGLDEVKVAVAYEIDGKVVKDFPASPVELEKCKPVYKTLKGWKKSTYGLTDKSQLPEEALQFIKTIEEETKIPVVMVSTGAERNQYIWL